MVNKLILEEIISEYELFNISKNDAVEQLHENLEDLALYKITYKEEENIEFRSIAKVLTVAYVTEDDEVEILQGIITH